MKICFKCNQTLSISSFVKYKNRHGELRTRNYCYQCKYKEEKPNINIEKRKINYKRYYEKNYKLAVFKSYRYQDRQRGLLDSITKEIFDEKITKPCFYCGVESSGGLDRIDNDLGHSDINTRPCCEKCNIIMIDLPDEAKLILKTSLTEIREKGILETWIIPTKRKKK